MITAQSIESHVSAFCGVPPCAAHSAGEATMHDPSGRQHAVVQTT